MTTLLPYLFVNSSHCPLKNKTTNNNKPVGLQPKVEKFVSYSGKKFKDKNQIITVLYSYLYWPSFSNQRFPPSPILGKKEKLQLILNSHLYGNQIQNSASTAKWDPFNDLIINIYAQTYIEQNYFNL